MSVPLTDNDWNEHYIKRGDPSKPTYYIIRWREYPGLFATVGFVASNVRYAISKGWIPVVDMQNYPSMYLAPEKLGKENAWEYFFEQPMRVGLEEAQNGENIVLGGQRWPISPPWSDSHYWDERKVMSPEWKMLVERDLLKIKPEITEEIMTISDKLFPPKERVLGAHLRGTDYLNRPRSHSIPPPTEYALQVVIDKMHEWKCDKLFLATEDKNILKIFQESFGDYLLTFNKPFKDFIVGKTKGHIVTERDNGHFLSGKEYLIEMMLLTKCNSFIAAQSAGNSGVMLFAEKFDNVYQFRFGSYGIYPKYKP